MKKFLLLLLLLPFTAQADDADYTANHMSKGLIYKDLQIGQRTLFYPNAYLPYLSKLEVYPPPKFADGSWYNRHNILRANKNVSVKRLFSGNYSSTRDISSKDSLWFTTFNQVDDIHLKVCFSSAVYNRCVSEISTRSLPTASQGWKRLEIDSYVPAGTGAANIDVYVMSHGALISEFLIDTDRSSHRSIATSGQKPVVMTTNGRTSSVINDPYPTQENITSGSMYGVNKFTFNSDGSFTIQSSTRSDLTGTCSSGYGLDMYADNTWSSDDGSMILKQVVAYPLCALSAMKNKTVSTSVSGGYSDELAKLQQDNSVTKAQLYAYWNTIYNKPDTTAKTTTRKLAQGYNITMPPGDTYVVLNDEPTSNESSDVWFNGVPYITTCKVDGGSGWWNYYPSDRAKFWNPDAHPFFEDFCKSGGLGTNSSSTTGTTTTTPINTTSSGGTFTYRGVDVGMRSCDMYYQFDKWPWGTGFSSADMKIAQGQAKTFCGK